MKDLLIYNASCKHCGANKLFKGLNLAATKHIEGCIACRKRLRETIYHLGHSAKRNACRSVDQKCRKCTNENKTGTTYNMYKVRLVDHNVPPDVNSILESINPKWRKFLLEPPIKV